MHYHRNYLSIACQQIASLVLADIVQLTAWVIGECPSTTKPTFSNSTYLNALFMDQLQCNNTVRIPTQ